MCLYLKNSKVRVKIAKEDIVVYKRLTNIPSIFLDKTFDGKTFIGTIYNIECSGKISIYKNEVYYCTNESGLNGYTIPKKHGYKYSWVHDKCVENIIVEGKSSIKTHNLYTPYQKAFVEIGKTYESAIHKVDDEVYKAIHSFSRVEDAVNDGFKDDIIVKCIIPEGSKYYIGTFNGAISYASNRLKYVEII